MTPLQAIAEITAARNKMPHQAIAVLDRAKFDDPAHLVVADEGTVLGLTLPVTQYDRNDTPLIDEWGAIAIRRGSGNYIYHVKTKMKHATLNRLNKALETQREIDRMRG